MVSSLLLYSHADPWINVLKQSFVNHTPLSGCDYCLHAFLFLPSSFLLPKISFSLPFFLLLFSSSSLFLFLSLPALLFLSLLSPLVQLDTLCWQFVALLG